MRHAALNGDAAGLSNAQKPERSCLAMHANLFDRFSHDDEGDVGAKARLMTGRNALSVGDVGCAALAQELADLLSSNRVFAARELGVLGWGMPPMLNMTAADAQTIANCIAEAIERFEPRLEQVAVAPLDDAANLSFSIQATLVEESTTIDFRVLAPCVGRSPGPCVQVVSIRDGLSSRIDGFDERAP